MMTIIVLQLDQPNLSEWNSLINSNANFIVANSVLDLCRQVKVREREWERERSSVYNDGVV